MFFFFFTHIQTHSHNFYFSNWIPHPPKIMCWFSYDASRRRRQWLWTSNFFLGYSAMPLFMIMVVAWLEFLLVPNYDQIQAQNFEVATKTRTEKKTSNNYFSLRYENIDIAWKCNKNQPHTYKHTNQINLDKYWVKNEYKKHHQNRQRKRERESTYSPRHFNPTNKSIAISR